MGLVVRCVQLGGTREGLVGRRFRKRLDRRTRGHALRRPQMPEGWTTQNHYQGQDNRYRWHNLYQSSGAISGTHNAACDGIMFENDQESQTAFGPKEEVLFTPELTLDDTYQLTFLWKSAIGVLNDESYTLQVRVVEQGADVATAPVVLDIADQESLYNSGVTNFPWTGWTPYASAIDLSAWQGKTVRIAFVHKMLEATANVVYIDDVKVEQFTPATTPVAEVTPAAKCYFGDVYLGSKKYSGQLAQPVLYTLENTGLDGLKVTAVESSSPDFSTTIEVGEVNLKRYETYQFQLVYEPTLTGASTDQTVTIKTNGGDITLEVTAVKLPLTGGKTFEGFENGVPPVGWTAADWIATGTALEGDLSASCQGSILNDSAWLVTPQLDFSSTGGTAQTLNFTYYENFISETLEVADSEFKVEDTIHLRGGKVGHVGVLTKGMIKVGDVVTLHVDEAGRADCCKNHSATHLLQKALKTVLGSHVEQKGSLVTPDRLRFDFAHFQAMTPEELEQTEALVNKEIQANLPVQTDIMTIDEAKKTGAMALFGEKYGEKVRVVSMGDFSKELCGGTHVSNTGVITTFKIISESGIAAGVRRIEALTGDGVFAYYKEIEKRQGEIAAMLKTTPGEIEEKIAHLQAEIKTLHSENESLKAKMAQEAMGDVMSQVQEIKGVKLLATALEDVDMNGLRDLGDQLKEKLGEGVVVLASVKGGKVNLLAMVTDQAQKAGAHAGNLIKGIAAIVGGGGGGRPNMAQAGGKNPEKVPEALKAAGDILADQIK